MNFWDDISPLTQLMNIPDNGIHFPTLKHHDHIGINDRLWIATPKSFEITFNVIIGMCLINPIHNYICHIIDNRSPEDHLFQHIQSHNLTIIRNILNVTYGLLEPNGCLKYKGTDEIIIKKMGGDPNKYCS